MAREKRTKPCSSCKKSKVRCIYTDTLPCERCVKIGQSSNCSFAPKLPTLRLPMINAEPNEYGTRQNNMILPPFKPLSAAPNPVLVPLSQSDVPPASIRQSHSQHLLSQSPLSSHQLQQQQHQPQGYSSNGTNTPLPVTLQLPGLNTNNSLYGPPAPPSSAEFRWRDQMENTMSNFDVKLSDLVDVLKSNQKLLMEQQEQLSIQQSNLNYYINQGNISTHNETAVEDSKGRVPLSRQISNDSLTSSTPSLHEYEDTKRRKILPKISDDFRDDVISLQEAEDLFHFFDSHITPQLFGFEISKFSVKSIWNNSPILICAICTISAMHHPTLCTKQEELLRHLHKLCGNILYQGTPRTEIEGFNTILALIFCSFWLSDSQMFTGLALQLAKEIGLDGPPSKDEASQLNPKDRLKLWYLLYVLDGQQSLTYNRKPLVNSEEYTLQHSRSLLLKNEKSIDNCETNNMSNRQDLIIKENRESTSPPALGNASLSNHLTFTDLRLVSQVEYNQALTAAFQGDAWSLLAPSSFGIPSKSNLELDKWMVSWTVLLSPMNNGAVWSSKSTLIYYNFAKMHINSSAVRSLRMESNKSPDEFPKLHQLKQISKTKGTTSTPPIDNTKDWEDSSDDDDEEFITNKELILGDKSSIDAGIAFNAAQTVLNLVLSDKDIKNNLKYVPVHVHIMLYYAALLLVEDQTTSNDNATSEEPYNKFLMNLGTVHSLRAIVKENFPVDRNFGHRLITSLDELLDERTAHLKHKILISNLPKSVKDNLLHKLSLLNEVSEKLEIFQDNSGSSSPGAIYAWPGSNHGHPSQN